MERTRNNKLHYNFIRAWKYLYLIQKTVGAAKVNIVENAVAPRVWYHKLFSSVNLVLCCISIFYLTSRSAFYAIDNEWSIRNALTFTQITVTLCLNNCPIIVNNFFYVDSNCELVLSLQQVDRALKITRNARHYTKIYWWNIGYISFLLLFHVGVNIYVVTQNIGYHELYLAVPAIFTLSAQDFELAFIYCIIYCLTLRVSYINSLLIRTTDSRWRSLTRSESPAVTSNILRAYRKLLRVYVLLQKTTSPFILLLCLHMISSQLIALEDLILYGEGMSTLSIFQYLSLVPKLFNRILFVGLLVTRLQERMALTRTTCLQIINETNNKECHQNVKNLLRLLAQSRPMSLLGTFPLGSLPRLMATVTATYAVVLLQFNFRTRT